MHSSSTRILGTLVLASLVSHGSAETLNGIPVEVLARSTVKLPDRVITFIRIRPPVFSAQPAVPPPAPVEPSAEEVLAQLRRDAKPFVQLGVRATVYAGSPAITELSWDSEDGRHFRAFSSVDFTHLTQITELEVPNTVYEWSLFVSDGDPAGLPSGVGEALIANGTAAQYLFEGSEADAAANQSTLQALDYLHAFFELHKTELVAATAQRAAEAAEQERQAAIKAALPKDQTIYFWKNEPPVPTP